MEQHDSDNTKMGGSIFSDAVGQPGWWSSCMLMTSEVRLALREMREVFGGKSGLDGNYPEFGSGLFPEQHASVCDTTPKPLIA